jgi:3-oxoacyl-[acyl-carrier protein] reductase
MTNEKTLIFGAAGGIGSALCRLVAKKGGPLHIAGRTEDSLVALKESLHQEGFTAECTVHTANATNADEVLSVFERAGATGGPVTAAVMCVGSIVLKPAHLTTPTEFESVLQQNLVTAFNLVRGAGKWMTQGGSVVLISSCAAQIGLPNHEAIAAVKAGVEGLARAAAATYAPRRLRFNVVAPGLTRTPLSKRITSTPQGEAASVALHPLGRLGEPSDVAHVVAFLLSEESGWITGQCYGVDGGLARMKG